LCEFWPEYELRKLQKKWKQQNKEKQHKSVAKDNATPAKQQRLQQNKKVCKLRQKTQPSLYIGMNMIVKGLVGWLAMGSTEL
jgi:hypothetical protein